MDNGFQSNCSSYAKLRTNLGKMEKWPKIMPSALQLFQALIRTIKKHFVRRLESIKIEYQIKLNRKISTKNNNNKLTCSKKYVVKLQRGSVLFSLSVLTWSSNFPKWRLNESNNNWRSLVTRFCQDSTERVNWFSLNGSHNWIILKWPKLFKSWIPTCSCIQTQGRDGTVVNLKFAKCIWRHQDPWMFRNSNPRWLHVYCMMYRNLAMVVSQ